jgi:hypothetical protein
LIALDAPDEIDRVSGQSLYSNRYDRGIGWYSRSINQKMLEAWEESEHNVEGAEPPLAQSFGGMILCHSQSAAQFSVLHAQDGASPSPLYQNVCCYFGPFHTLMKLQHASGQMFSDIFDLLFGSYHVSENRIKWIKAPKDNRQRETEDPEMAQAVYGSAAEFYAEHHGEYPSVQQLNEFMLERGRQSLRSSFGTVFRL